MADPDEDDGQQGRSIVVRGLQPSKENLDKLELYFQSKRQSGGGDVETVAALGDELIRVVFEEADIGAAKRVCSRSHTIDGWKVEVKIDSPSPKRKGLRPTARSLYPAPASTGGDEPAQPRGRGRTFAHSRGHPPGFLAGNFPGSTSTPGLYTDDRMGTGQSARVHRGPSDSEVAYTAGNIQRQDHSSTNRRQPAGEFECDPRALSPVPVDLYGEEEAGGNSFAATGNRHGYHGHGYIYGGQGEWEHSERERHSLTQPVSPNITAHLSQSSASRPSPAQRSSPGSSTAKRALPEWQVEVHGIPIKMSPEDVRAYFESSKASGGALSTVEFDRDGVAYLIFQDVAAAERVCQKRDHRLQGQLLDVCPYQQQAGAQFAMSTPPCDGKDVCSSIQVRGLPPTASGDMLEMYFENERRSGGDEIEEMLFDSEYGTAKITYANSTVAERVCSQQHNLFGCTLEVVLFTAEQSQPVTKILVSGLPENANQDMVELYFENKKRSGGEDVIEVVMGPLPGQALVSFASEEVAGQVCARSHHLGGRELTVKAFQEAGMAKNEEDEMRLIVTNIPPEVDEEFLGMYFENTKRSGGGEITNFKHYPEHATAVITFSDKSIVAHVCSRQHKMKGNDIQVSRYQRDLDPDLSPALQPCTVQVFFSDDIDEEFLGMYFESSKHSGGGEIANIHVEKHSKSALVTFKDPEVALEVAKRPHKLKSSLLKVQLCSPKKSCTTSRSLLTSDFEPDKVLLLGIPRDINEEMLRLYIEAHAKVPVESLEIRRENCRALAVLKEPCDFQEAARRVQRNKLSGEQPQLHRVQVSRTLRIINMAEARLNSEYIQLYFEKNNLKVTVVVRGDQADVIFPTPEDAEVIYSSKHTLNNTILKLHPVVAGWDFAFPEELHQDNSSQGRAARASAADHERFPVDVPAEILTFLMSNVEVYQQLQEQLSRVHAAVEDISTTPVWIQPTKGAGNVFDWQKHALDISSSFFGDLHKIETKVPEDVLSIIAEEDELRKRLVPLKKSLVYRISVDTQSVSFTGTASAIQQAQEILCKVTADIEEQLQHREEDIMKVKPDQVSLLLKSRAFDELQRRYRHTKIKQGKQRGHVHLEGPQREIRLAANDVMKKTNEMFDVIINFEHAPINRVMTSDMGVAFAQSLVDLNQLEAVVATKGGKMRQLRLVGWNSDEMELETVKEQLREKISEDAYTLNLCEEEALRNPKWKQTLSAVHQKYLVHLVEPSRGGSAGQIAMLGVTEHIQHVRRLLAEYFRENAILTKLMELKSGQVRFLQTYQIKEVTHIAEQFKDHQVAVALETNQLCVRGTQKGVELAVCSCKQLLQRVADLSMEITRPGMKKYFAKDEAKKQLVAIEKTLRVVIEQDAVMPAGATARPSTGGIDSMKPKLVVMAATKSGMKISIYCGDITKHSCDIMVNAANDMLSHIGGVAKAIVQAGGKEIQDACSKHIRTNGRLLTGQVYVSKAGRLPCKQVIHAVGPNWSGGQANEARYLQQAVHNSLQKASNASSVAFPAISTGIFGFPARLAVEVMVNTAMDFSLASGSRAQLHEVHFVDQSEQIISEFVSVLSDIFQNDEGKLIWPDEAGAPGSSRMARESATYRNDTRPMPRTRRQPSTQTSPNTVTTAEGKVVHVVRGDLSKQTTDAIVNTSASDLNLKHGMVAKVLSQAAGQGLQAECSAYVQQHGNLAAGQFAVTRGHQLQCRKVFHLVADNYNNAGGVQVLENGLLGIFTEANRLGFRSIALPSLGTGNLGFPARVSAQTMFSAVEKFSRKAPSGSLSEFRFAVFDQDIAADFFQVASLQQSQSPAAHYPEELGEIGEASPLRGRLRSAAATAEEYPAETEVSIKREGDVLCGALPGHQLQIHLFQGDIVFEKSQAIIIAANSQLTLERGVVLKTVAKAGGPALQHECSQVATNCSLREGDVCSTSGGKLPCQHIIHAIVPRYNQRNTRASQQALEDIVLGALKEADKLTVNSVALPALGTGVILGYPAQIAAEATMAAVCNFAAQTRHVSTVRLVVYDKQILSGFEQEFKTQLSGVQVTRGHEPGLLAKVAQKLGIVAKENPQPSETSTSIAAMLSSVDTPLWLRIYGASPTLVKDAKKEIEDLQEKQHRDRVINNEGIIDLTRNDEARIRKLTEEFGVDISIEKGLINRIRVRGDAMGVSDASGQIHEIISNAVETARVERHADQMAQVVEWVRVRPGFDEQYDKYINLKLEDAWSANRDKVDVIINGQQCTVDFKKMEEKGRTQTCSVRRVDLTKKDKLPSFWDPQQGKKCLLVPLASTDPMYKKVKQRFRQTSQRQIVKIERVQNPELYKQYIAKKDSMDNAPNIQNKANEMRLFHGSDEATITKICTQGFNRSFAGRNATAFGRGVYFALNSQYSEGYAQQNPQGHFQMIQALVLVGDFCVGSSSMVAPSPRDPSKDSVDLFDSTVNNMGQPTIFVTYTDAQTYPEYVITFT